RGAQRHHGKRLIRAPMDVRPYAAIAAILMVWQLLSPPVHGGVGSMGVRRIAARPSSPTNAQPTGSGSLSKGVNDPVPLEPRGPDEGFSPAPDSMPAPPLQIGNLQIADPADHPRIPALDNDDPQSLFYTMRPNLFGEQIPDEWDFGNIIATDRPDFTDAPFTVGRHVAVWESGYTFRRIEAEGLNTNR